MWNNGAYTADEVYVDETSSATITYSDIDDSDLSAGTGDIDANPTFARNPAAGPDGVWGTSDDDYGDLQLVLGSPGIDAGNNADIPSDVTTDILGNPRIINSADTSDNADGIVDMGAYETFPVYVDSGIESGISFGGIQPQIDNAGTSWANAYTDLNDAAGPLPIWPDAFRSRWNLQPRPGGHFNFQSRQRRRPLRRIRWQRNRNPRSSRYHQQPQRPHRRPQWCR